jgi:hypothetical protein
MVGGDKQRGVGFPQRITVKTTEEESSDASEPDALLLQNAKVQDRG